MIRKCTKNKWLFGMTCFILGSLAHYLYYTRNILSSHASDESDAKELDGFDKHLVSQRESYVKALPGATQQSADRHDATDNHDADHIWDMMKMKAAKNDKLLEKVSWYCQADKHLQEIPSPTRMYNIPAYNLSLTLIAKVASTSWVAFLAKTVIPHCVEHIDNPSTGYASLHECVKTELALNSDKPKHAVRAVFVRNPWERLVSVYEDKILKQRFVQASSCYARWNISRAPAVGEDRDIASLPNLSFVQFVTCISEMEDPNVLDPHYRPQYLMHGPCTAQYTHIGTLEDVENDFLYIMRAAQPSLSYQNLKDYLKFFRKGPRRPWEVTDDKEKHRKFTECYKSVSNELMSSLQDVYKWDVMLYGYKMHPLASSS